MDLQWFAEKVLTEAHEAIRESGEYWPHAFVFDQNQQGDVLVFKPEITASESGKTEVSRLPQAAAIGVNGFVVLISDTWTLPQEAYPKSQEETPAIISDGTHNHPQRIDCLIVSVFGPGLKPMLGQQTYHKNKHECPLCITAAWNSYREFLFSHRSVRKGYSAYNHIPKLPYFMKWRILMAAKILLVLSPQNRTRLLGLLEGKGLDIFLASGFTDAQQRLGEPGSYDLLFVDAEHPDGSWRDLLDFVLSYRINCQIIVCSRIGDEQLWAEVLQCGAFDLIVEPYEQQDVLRIVHSAIESQHIRKFARTEARQAS